MTNVQEVDRDAGTGATFVFATVALSRLNGVPDIVAQSVWGALPRREGATLGSGSFESAADLVARFERGSQPRCAIFV